MSDDLRSPLCEADPASIDLLLDRVCDHLAAGVPEKIRAEDLFTKLISGFRTQAERWQAAELEAKPPRSRRGLATVEKINIDDLI